MLVYIARGGDAHIGVPKLAAGNEDEPHSVGLALLLLPWVPPTILDSSAVSRSGR